MSTCLLGEKVLDLPPFSHSHTKIECSENQISVGCLSCCLFLSGWLNSVAGATLINQPRRKQTEKSYKRNPSHPTPYRKLLRPRSLKFSSRTFQLPKRKKQRYDIPPSQTCFAPETLGVEGVREKPISSRNKQPEEKNIPTQNSIIT